MTRRINKGGESAGPWIVSANFSLDHFGRLRPINFPIIARELGRINGTGWILRLAWCLSAGELSKRLEHGVRSNLRESIVERATGVVRQNRELLLQENIPGIET